MQKRLTLRMEQDLIEYAKEHAQKHGTSVSKMVARYFAALASKDRPEEGSASLPPITSSLAGSLAGSDVSKEDYCRYLEEKHA